ncbi:MAG: hypothetical protein GX902_03590 [Lentisphaerae bacterium]|nr:hypothetical protein [Lentisphaerota bacterium]
MNTEKAAKISWNPNGIHTLAKLQIDAQKYRDCLIGWGDSVINMPEKIDFLEADTITELCDWLQVEEETAEMLRQTAARILSEPNLKAYVWHMYYRLKALSLSTGCSHASFANWPLPEFSLGKYAQTVPALVMLGGLKLARQKYREERYEESIIKDTLRIYGADLDRKRRANGVPTILLNSLNWVRVYMAARLVELGRFNYKLMEDFKAGVVLKNRRTGTKQMLAPDGAKYNSAGFMLQENDPLAEGGWVSEYSENAGYYYGNPVSPKGFALKEVRRYAKEEWEKILEPGDILIDMHIPAGGGMTPERCLDSFRKAVEFFTEKYEGKFKPVFICHSWIFNTQLEEKLPESNLAKLMQQCYLFPASSYGQDGVFFLFGQVTVNPADAPRDTSVRRAVLEILESGQRLRSGGMLLFAEDLEHFGTAFYRRTCG